VDLDRGTAALPAPLNFLGFNPKLFREIAMAKQKVPPLQEKMEDIVKASSIVNQAVKACQAWDHYDNVEQAIEKMREAQKLLKQQFEEWKKTSAALR
jgi:hypothetical protein